MHTIASINLVTASWVAVITYMVVILFFVIRGARKISNISDYAVGSIAFSPIAVGLALAASMTSAATFIINPGFIALYGISAVISYAIVLPIAAMISLVILTKGFRKHGSNVKALTMAQWMGTRYNSKGYSLFFAFLSFYAVHGPIQTTNAKWKKYREKAIKNGLAESGYTMERVLPIRQKQDNPVMQDEPRSGSHFGLSDTVLAGGLCPASGPD